LRFSHSRPRAVAQLQAQSPTSSQGPLDVAVVTLDAGDVLSDALVEDRVPRRTRRLQSDPVLAVLTGVRSALAIAIATAWPTGATAVIIVATACSLLASLEQPVIATLALVRSDATHVPDDRELDIGNKILLGVAGFEPVTPASRTQCTSSKLLSFLAVARVSVLFCSRSFHPIRCDFVAALLNENGAH
jgi:hypothetical protein